MGRVSEGLTEDNRRLEALFDRDWYLSQYQDVAKAQLDALQHYVERGRDEGRAPCRAIWLQMELARETFDAEWYASQYPDVAAYGDPLAHYVEHGIGEGRSPSRLAFETRELASSAFDADWYLRKYRDIAEAGIDALTHYITLGKSEGRHPTIDHARAAAWVRTFGSK